MLLDGDRRISRIITRKEETLVVRHRVQRVARRQVVKPDQGAVAARVVFVQKPKAMFAQRSFHRLADKGDFFAVKMAKLRIEKMAAYQVKVLKRFFPTAI